MAKTNAHTAFKLALTLSAAVVLSGCIGSNSTKLTDSEQELLKTMSASQFQPRTQLEREAIATQSLFAQAAFWSREYDLNPGDLEAAINLSATLRKMGNPEQGLEISKSARAMFPRDTDLIVEYGANLIALERGKDAIGPLSTAARLAPRNSRLLSMLGAAHDQIGQFAKARDFYAAALKYTPNDSNILANVGLSYALEGDPRTAEIWLRRAAQNPSANAQIRQNLALVLGLQGKFSEAESLAREDLNAAGAENNLAYLRAMRGGARTYEALENPEKEIDTGGSSLMNAPSTAQSAATQMGPQSQPLKSSLHTQNRGQNRDQNRGQNQGQNLNQYHMQAQQPMPSKSAPQAYGQKNYRQPENYRQMQPSNTQRQNMAPQNMRAQTQYAPQFQAQNHPQYGRGYARPQQTHQAPYQAQLQGQPSSRLQVQNRGQRQTPTGSYPSAAPLPQSRPNMTQTTGGALQAARQAAQRIQSNGAKRTIPYTADQAAQQQDILAKLGQSLALQKQPSAPQGYPQPAYTQAPVHSQYPETAYSQPYAQYPVQQRAPARRRD